MSKGTRREREACELYERAGYTTYRPATVQYGENDVFGLFDLVAVDKGRKPRFVQVKSNAARGIKEWVAEVQALMPPEWTVSEFLVCHDREGWRLIQPVGESWSVVWDGREYDDTMGDGLVEFLSP